MLNRQGTAITVSVGLLTAVALAFAIFGYVSWSSNAAYNEFMNTASASESSTPVQQGPTGCPVGKKKLPTQINPPFIGRVCGVTPLCWLQRTAGKPSLAIAGLTALQR